MSGLISYIGALADDLSVVATKVAAGSLDDIANQTAKSLSKTAGILIDDTATIPQYVSNTAAKRELPVIWKITKKSLRNKALMIPIAILITYFSPWIMAPILILGGSYLAYEGTESLAEYSLGTYIGSVLEATLSPPIKPKENWRKLMNDMSVIASYAYRSNLKKDKNFLEYYYHVTPQKILEHLFIGSRPTKRKKSQGIKNLRAIPWVFAWTQIRFILPAWLGTLEALNIAKKGKNKIILKDMLKHWPFFYAMMDIFSGVE